jgi:mycothiol synthase
MRRPAGGLDDLRLAASILSRAWLDGSPFVASHPGDLEWWFGLAAPDDLGDHLRLWEVDGAAAAWSWVRGDQVHWEIRVDDPAVATDILDAILRDAIAVTDSPMHAWAPEDDPATLGALARLGFGPDAGRLSQFQCRVDDDAPIGDDGPPDGYRIRHVAGPAEIPARADLHRAAIPYATLTIEQYARLTTLPHYRFEDDLVVEAADGSLAAFAMAWWDPVARVGEFEPVGTHPAHRRRGLGRALLRHGLRRFHELGAVCVQVCSHAEEAASEGLYQAVGFERRRYRRRFERPRGGDVRSVT